MTAALLAMAAVWLVAGASALRRSRRDARMWAALALAAITGAAVCNSLRVVGPWWPLQRWPVGPGEAIAAVLWGAALGMAWQARPKRIGFGEAVLATGTAALALGLAAGAVGALLWPHSGRDGAILCLGQPRDVPPWTATLTDIRPVVSSDYSGVAARVWLAFPDGLRMEVVPEQRDYGPGGSDLLSGSALVTRWNGELLIRVAADPTQPDCARVQFEWQAFAQWLRYGLWLSLAAALILAGQSLRGFLRHKAAWDRIAMRRDDQGRVGPAIAPRAQVWQPLAIALAAAVAGYAVEAGLQPAPASPAPPPQAATMIAAREAIFGGPALSNRWLVISDALARHGQFGEAADVLVGAVDKDPGNAEAWLALGDALWAQAGGRMVAAARLAYVRADRNAAAYPELGPVVAKSLALSGRRREATAWPCRVPGPCFPAPRQH